MIQNDFPQAVEMEKKILSALFMKNGLIVPKVVAILKSDDFYRPEHQMIFRAVKRLHDKGSPIDFLTVEEELRKVNDLQKIDRRYWLALLDAAHSTAYAESYAKTIKEKSDLRKIICAAQIIIEDARKETLPPREILTKAQSALDKIRRDRQPSTKISFADFFANHFKNKVDEMKIYANRKTGFSNLDAHQIFNPGLYIICATPEVGKSSFCGQILEQFARQGDSCIFCSYEMSCFEFCAKSVAREIFRKVPDTDLTVADIQHGGWLPEINQIVADFAAAEIDLQILELQDETVDDLLDLLKPLCTDKSEAPVICLDYLQIIPAKFGIENSGRKIKKFQRDTNTTFIVVSNSKEPSETEFIADVVWTLQLSEELQPQKILLKCLKNRQGTKYECSFLYHSAHDYLEPLILSTDSDLERKEEL